MTENERRILEVLAEALRMELMSPDRARYMRPTQIGMACGKPYARASSWACRYLCKLRDRGLVRREPPGVYAITAAGVAALHEHEGGE